MGKNGTWLWQDFESWKDIFWEMMSDVVTLEVIAKFRSKPPKYIVGDDLSWLDSIIEKIHGGEFDTQTILTERIYESYDSLRAYHGSRPLNIEKFYLEGLHPLDSSVFESRAFELFLIDSFPELTSTSIQDAIDSVGKGKKYREGLLYFEANEKFLVKYCAHYMLYGSEYLCAIAANIDGTTDYRQHLKKFGTPVIFECDIPLDLIEYRQIKEFAGSALEAMFVSLLESNFKHATHQGAGIYIRKPLAPKCIVGHKTPLVLNDPFLGRLVKTNAECTSGYS